MTNLVFVHGWGSGPFVWQKIIPDFKNHNCHTVNLGFLGEEYTNTPNEPFVGIGHSLGGMWLLRNYPKQMIGFVSIASFNCFYKHTAKNILSSMQKNIIKNTAAQMKDFWTYAGMTQPKNVMNLKPLKLLEGLKHLSKWQADIPDDLPIQVLASRDDYIVPEKMMLDIWNKQNINWIENGGHMLPITQPEFCIKHIKDMIEAIK